MRLDNPQPLESAGPLTLLMRSPAHALLANGVVCLLLLVALAMAAFRRKVLQLPSTAVLICLGIWVAVLLFSVVGSGYRTYSLVSVLPWLFYPLALLAGVSLSGRKEGAAAVLLGATVGSGVVALLGVLEYVGQPDPSWRIFSTWFHPNALAGLLVLVLPVGLALAARGGRQGIVAMVAVALQASALLLTQSKGGLLALAVGLLALLALACAWVGVRAAGPAIARGVLGLVLGVALFFGATRAVQAPAALPSQAPVTSQMAPTQPSNAPLSRLTNAGATAEQSAGFRRLLWSSALGLVRENPLGWGFDTFRYNSARTGQTTATLFAHNTYLQLAAEATLLAPLLLLALVGLALVQMARAARALPAEQNLLRAGVAAALLASGAHNLVDSDLYHFGIGFLVFLLVGVGLQLSADGSAPEWAPKGWRVSLAALATVVLALLFKAGVTEVGLANAMGFLQGGARTEAITTLDGLRSSAAGDGRVWYLSAAASASPQERVQRLQQAFDLLPTPRHGRALARALLQEGNNAGAQIALKNALRIDPNNLATLAELWTVQKLAGLDEWRDTAEQLVAVELTPYYKVRSIPEMVPTETAEARVALADVADEREAAQLLRAAVDIYLAYAAVTAPKVLQMHRAIPGARFGEDGVKEAGSKLDEAIRAAKRLEVLYRAKGNSEGEVFCASAVASLTSVSDTLRA